MRVLVVGASLAGARTVQALRREGSDARITLVDAGDAVACDRPPLSKKFLADPAVVRRAGADAPKSSTRSTSTSCWPPGDRPGHRGPRGRARRRAPAGVRRPRDRDRLRPADRAGIAMLPGVTTLRTDEDAALIRAALVDGARAVVVGGGFVGAEVGVDRAVGHGCDRHDRRAAAAPHGARARRRRSARRSPGGTRRPAPTCGSASAWPRCRHVPRRVGDADRRHGPAGRPVVVGVGTVPQTGVAGRQRARRHRRGALRPRLAAVGASGVYAAGDVARWTHPRHDAPIRVEHWTNAVEHGPVVAREHQRAADGLRRAAVRLVRPARRAAADLRPGGRGRRGAVRLRRARRAQVRGGDRQRRPAERRWSASRRCPSCCRTASCSSRALPRRPRSTWPAWPPEPSAGYAASYAAAPAGTATPGRARRRGAAPTARRPARPRRARTAPRSGRRSATACRAPARRPAAARPSRPCRGSSPGRGASRRPPAAARCCGAS